MKWSGSKIAPVLTVTPNPAIDKAVEAPGFAPGRHVRARVLRTTPAGKGINVARGVAALGGHAEASALVGCGEEARFAALLDGEGISARLVTVEGPTRINTTILDPEQHTTTHLREEGFHVSEGDVERLKDAVLETISSIRKDVRKPAVAFCGSLPPGFSPPAFASILKAAGEAGGHIAVDTSDDALRAALESGAVDVLKPNLAELGQCLGREVNAGEGPRMAGELLDRVGRVLLTLGEAGAYHIGPDGVVGARCPVEAERVTNTVGAGDAFLAGWLCARSRGWSVEKSLSWAVSTGSASVTSRGPVEYDSEAVRRAQERCEKLRSCAS